MRLLVLCSLLACAFGQDFSIQIANVQEQMWINIGSSHVTSTVLSNYFRRFQNTAKSSVDLTDDEFRYWGGSYGQYSWTDDMQAYGVTDEQTQAYFRIFDVYQGYQWTDMSSYRRIQGMDVSLLVDVSDNNPRSGGLNKAEWDFDFYNNNFEATPYSLMFVRYQTLQVLPPPNSHIAREAVESLAWRSIFNEIDVNADGQVRKDETRNWWEASGYGSPAYGDRFFNALDALDFTRAGYGTYLDPGDWDTVYGKLDLDGWPGMGSDEFVFGLHCVANQVRANREYNWDWCT